MKPIGLPLAGCLAVVAVVAVALSRPSAGTITLPPSIPSSGEAASVLRTAVVDDQGAVVREVRAGGITLVGVSRSAGRVWSVTVPPDIAPLSCLGCPNVLAGTRDGRLLRYQRGVADVVAMPAEPEDLNGGLPGFGPNTDRPVWSTRPGSGVRLRALQGAAGPAQLRGSGIDLPLSNAQERDAFVAVSQDGRRAMALTTIDVAHAGERRILQVEGGTKALDVAVPVTVRDPSDPVSASACLAPDGRTGAVLLPAGKTASLAVVPWGSPPETMVDIPLALEKDGFVSRCAFTRSQLLVFGPSADGDSVRIVQFARGQPLRVTDIGVKDVSDATACSDGTIVVQLAGRLLVKRPGMRPAAYSGEASGCTPQGVVWVLRGASVSWLKTSEMGEK